jgi:hypothetical protein
MFRLVIGSVLVESGRLYRQKDKGIIVRLGPWVFSARRADEPSEEEIGQRVEMGVRMRIRTKLSDGNDDLRQAIVKVARSAAKDFFEEQREAARTERELRIPCKDGFSDHDFTVERKGDVTFGDPPAYKTCSRCTLPEHWLMPAGGEAR